MPQLSKSSLPWIVAAVCAAALLAAASEIGRLKQKVGQISDHAFHDHADVRQFVIRAALARVDDPIVIVGDSITEMAPLPAEMCGHPIVNAGIGGLNTPEAKWRALRVLEGRKAFLVVVALGANDSGLSVRTDFGELLRLLQPHSARPLAVVSVTDNAATADQINAAAAAFGAVQVNPIIPSSFKMDDRIHYTGAAYDVWVRALESAIVKECE